MNTSLIKQSIVNVRRSLNLTQVEMAHIIGVSRQSYINLENCKISIINKQIVRMSEIFGIPEELILFGIMRKRLSEDNEMLIAELREKLDSLIQLIRESKP